MAGRDVGKMGQSEFERLCSSVDLARNVSREDRTGWDYLVEFPLARSPGQPADMAPPALECRVQVKATDKGCRKWDVPLQNLERLAKSPIPAFICLLEFDGKEHTQQVYLVHVGEVIIGRVLKRLRQLEMSPQNAAKKPTLSITCGDSDRLPQPSGVCLKEAIESHIPKGMDEYCRWKRQLLDTLGYEGGHPCMKVQFSSKDPIQDLIDLSLGYRKSLKVSNMSMHDVRFGMECVLPDPHGPGELSISSAPSEGAIIFRERRSSPGVEFAAKVYTPSVNRVVPTERATFRIQTRFFDLLVQPFADKGTFNLLPDARAITAGLAELRNLLMLLCMMRSCGSKGIWMDVAMKGKELLPGGQMSVHSKIRDPTDDLEVVEQALAVARAYGIDDQVSVSINDVRKSRESIGIFCKMIQGQVGEYTPTFFVTEEPSEVEPKSGIIFHGYLPLGAFLLHCIVGIVGRLERIGDKQYRLTTQGNCRHRCALTKAGQEMEEEELADVRASIEEEMTAEGIGPVIIIER